MTVTKKTRKRKARTTKGRTSFKTSLKSGHIKAIDYQKTATHKELVATFLDYLDRQKIIATETDAALTRTVDGSFRKNKILPGWPDITGCLPIENLSMGLFFGVEVKTETDELRDTQKKMHLLIRNCHGIVIVAYTNEDLANGIRAIKNMYKDKILVTKKEIKNESEIC